MARRPQKLCALLAFALAVPLAGHAQTSIKPSAAAIAADADALAAEAIAAEALLDGREADGESAEAPTVSCGSVRYRPLSRPEQQSLLSIGSGALNGPQLEAPLPSPQGSLELLTIRLPDFRKPGPWSTVIAVRPSKDARVAGQKPWMLAFANHNNIHVQARWLNEKLLFARSWAQPHISMDWLFDAESGQMLYADEATYSAGAGRCRP
jgi:hypothetical protein